VNFALPTVAIILALIPGIVFRTSYFSNKFPREVYGASPISELAQYFLFALPIDAFAIYIFYQFQDVQQFSNYLNATVIVFTGQFSDNKIETITESVKQGWLSFLVTYFAVVTAAFLSGSILRRIVWTFRLDVFRSPLRMRNDWYYILQGRLLYLPRQIIPIADILTEHPDEGSRLYRGIVSGFNITSNGDLKELILNGAMRSRGRGDEFEWVEIPGNEFIIFNPTIHSVNMTYVSAFDLPEDRYARIKWYLRIYMRSFLFQEP